MAAQPLEIHVDPESETGKLLAQARERSIHIVSDGRRFRLVPEESTADDVDPFAGYDPERAAAAWRALADANIFEGVDTEVLKAELREMRGQDSIGRPGS